jgi:hypothetical protein
VPTAFAIGSTTIQATDDRARQAYAEFVPLDGKFRDNVVLQVKNGPIDFQPREPFHPLFGAMPRTPRRQSRAWPPRLCPRPGNDRSARDVRASQLAVANTSIPNSIKLGVARRRNCAI